MNTAQEVIDAIKTHIKKWIHELPAGGFAHIVLDDFNLADGHIDHCLEPQWVNEWYAEKVKECIESWEENPLSPFYYERPRFTDFMHCVDETIDLLEALKQVPAEIRDQAEALVHDS